MAQEGTALRRGNNQSYVSMAGAPAGAHTDHYRYSLPVRIMRFLVGIAIRLVYRLRINGHENIPQKSGALLVCNHVSLIDGFLLLVSTNRPIRFLIDEEMYHRPVIRFFTRLINVIPISTNGQPRKQVQSLQLASKAIQRGDLVCVFPEGQITRLGQLLPFKRGFLHILKQNQVPVIPVNIDGMWGRIFSYERGRFFWKKPRRVAGPVTVSYGQPLPNSAGIFEVRQAVQKLGTDSRQNRKPSMKPVHRHFVRTARRHPGSFAFADSRVPSLKFGLSLTRTIFLAQRLKKYWHGQKMVGILLPPSVAGTLVNLAALLMGKIPVNLNYTTSNQTLASCARQCDIQTVITSKAFLDKVNLEVPATSLLLEEIALNPGIGEKVRALIKTYLYPVRLLERSVGSTQQTKMDDVATVIFSSGSTGDPKGVVLSHYNVVSNVQQVLQAISVTPDDRFLGILPFFHSFGFTATLCLPVIARCGVVFHPNPLEASTIGKLVRTYSISFLLATPTFLQIYTRGCSLDDLASLRFVMTGAEKLRERTAREFERRFGIRPLEGYGCTECAPIVSANTLDYHEGGLSQVGSKCGTIGRPLPGMSVKIVDPDTHEPLPVEQAGLLLVRGPNVMQGYLDQPSKTAEVLKDGWYVTGDIAKTDEDGFLTITDRLSRFSKIGGEMVPHIRVEDRLQDLSGVPEQAFIVTGVTDEKKGERLVVLHTLAEHDIKGVLKQLSGIDLPNLWIPRVNHFYRIDSLPYLGTGKIDLRRIRQLAEKHAGPC